MNTKKTRDRIKSLFLTDLVKVGTRLAIQPQLDDGCKLKHFLKHRKGVQHM